MSQYIATENSRESIIKTKGLRLVVKELTLVEKVAVQPWWVHECGFS